MKTREDKRIEAEIRALHSTFKAPANPCKDCRNYKDKWCSYQLMYVPRKSTCETFKRR